MVFKKVLKIIAVWSLAIVVYACLGDIVIASERGVVSADFLNIGSGSRAAGMGDAYTSVASDVTAGYWNPAGLAKVDSWQLHLSHYLWYQDISYNSFAAAKSVGNKAALAASIIYVGYGSIEGYDINGNPTGKVASTYNLAAGLSSGYELWPNFSAGITAKYVYMSLAGTTSGAMAADFGLKYHLNKFTFGLAMANIGQKMKFNGMEEKLPANVRFGVSVNAIGSSLLGSFEIEKPFEGDIIFKNGYEYNFDNYFLRIGYNYFTGHNEREMSKGMSFGAGAKLGHTRFDYTYTPDQRVSSDDLHKFSIRTVFKK